MILELELALFQTAQLKLVVQDIAAQEFYDCIEIAMFYLQLDDSSLYFFQWDHGLGNECLAYILKVNALGA